MTVVRCVSSKHGLTPDKGYHGTLVANRTDSTWDYYSKDGTQYHYKFITQRVQWKLMWVRDAAATRSPTTTIRTPSPSLCSRR
ncbi:hypothetical protein PEC18_03445 [Paucibacter sp. O1-1]|nr:hypothetical protein [Paucibacter sp. O1-1]MDA3824932.1 hypothetical protein [Paucibacter sp. O1-1]